MEDPVLNFIGTTWRLMPLWKFLMVAAVAFFSLWILSIESYMIGLDFDHGIKAPFFALASAATLFIGMIPKNPQDYTDLFVDVLIRLVGAGTACLAGWHWFVGEVEGDSDPYLRALMPVFVIVGGLVVIPFVVYVIMSIKDAISSRKPSRDDGHYQ